MLLKNEKQKPIPVIYQGKKTVVYPGQTIEGPVQLTIYGLTIVDTNPISPILMALTPVESKSEIKESNEKEIDGALAYIKSYTKTKLPHVAICILSKDSFHLINDCVSSIQSKVDYPNTSIYIFDTGTTDKQTIDLYDNYKQGLSRIPIHIKSVGEFNFSKNYNTGLKIVDKECNADYYVIQNNDTVAINDYITRLVHIAIVKKVGACGPRMLYKDGLIQHDGQIIYNHAEKGFGSPTHVNLKKNVNDVSAGIQTADGITCAGMFVRSSVFWEVGGLNEDYHDIFQDVELNIKIRMGGHSIICDRNALINHYDNTSRNKFWANNVQKLNLKHLDYSYLFSKFNNKLKYVPRYKKKFSIVTVVSNEEQYTNFLNDLKLQDCEFDFEIVSLPNFNGEYDNCAAALNVGIGLSESEYVIMCHQDLRVPSNWLSNIFDKIREFIIGDITFGVLGMAGSWVNRYDSDGVIYLSGNTHDTKYKEVQCLDELCLIIKSGNSIRFDEERFPHFHCYGSDLCLSYLSKGYRNFAINCPCTHLSDGFKNLTEPKQLDIYIKNTITLYKKWRNVIPEFRNTTAKFSKIENSITFYVSEELRNRGINLKKYIVLPD
jgi:GT2 family glycosyltransferase